MSCVLETKDIVAEQTGAGSLTSIPGLTVSQTAGVLAGLAKVTDQAYDVISCKGLGKYGLYLRDLQLVGVIKKGISASSDPAMVPVILESGEQCLADPSVYLEFLADQSVFTGKNDVYNVDTLLADEELQQQLMNEVIVQNMYALEAQGVITGNETYEELAAIAGMSAKFSLDEIIDKIAGFFDPLFTALDFAFDALDAAFAVIGHIAAFGAILATIKNLDILGKLTGFGAAIISSVEQATDTIDQADTNKGVDDIKGSARLESEASLSSAESTADKASGFSLSSLTGGLL